jgi:hypothetical protein
MNAYVYAVNKWYFSRDLRTLVSVDTTEGQDKSGVNLYVAPREE